ncbi:Similar to tr/Q8YK90/Q8YK90 [Planktothrix rubescens NIVA-CYA 18]|nr:Similar to tr/Q8YK90/Q8YK90 [Planktothrix rubescens NIVA-CYA 18]
MQSIQFKGRIGKDGILRVQMPAEFKDRDLEAIVIFQAASENLKHENWQPGFFEE